jgi:hypothetical protein
LQVTHHVHNIGKFDWTRLRRHGDQQQQTGHGARVAENATLHVVRQLPPEVCGGVRHSGFSSIIETQEHSLP